LVYYPVPIHRQPYLHDLLPEARSSSLPVTDLLASEVLSIPVRAGLSDEDLAAVIAAVRTVATPESGSVASVTRRQGR
jgi:dTDP-4-amino-4,6-dideoxygalactose transaminase